MGKVSQLRRGTPTHKSVILGEVKFEVVILSVDIVRSCEEDTEQYASNNKGKTNDTSKEQYYNSLVVYHCLRDADDPTLNTKAADSHDEISRILDPEDISRVLTVYGELLINKAPKLELMTEDQYQDLKKYLEVTQLNDLSTVSLVHLMNFHQAMPTVE